MERELTNIEKQEKAVRKYYNVKKAHYEKCKKAVCKKLNISLDTLIHVLYQNLPYYNETFKKNRIKQIESEVIYVDPQKRILLGKEYGKTKAFHKSKRKKSCIF